MVKILVVRGIKATIVIEEGRKITLDEYLDKALTPYIFIWVVILPLAIAVIIWLKVTKKGIFAIDEEEDGC